MEDFDSYEHYSKFQKEWALLNLVKELRGISNYGAMPTYYNAIKLGMQILPEIFNEHSEIVKRHHEPELARQYRQEAEAQSQIEGRDVDPIELVDKRILELNILLTKGKEGKDLLEKQLDKLQKVRSLFLPKNIKEDFILHHDLKCDKFDVQPIDIKAKHTDYLVAENRMIRVRMIHPNEGEQKLGADLIYEQYDFVKKKVRFIMVQYKIWDGELIYWSAAKNLNPQLDKMSNNLCGKGYCNCDAGLNTSGEYRYPYCCAFLRPTDKLQYKDSKFTSSGMHIPVCKINSVTKETKDGNKVLYKNDLRETSLSQKIFEECFNYNQVGSRWMDFDEAEKLYKEHEILDNDEHIIVHVQELEI